jgi:hypothetical protein
MAKASQMGHWQERRVPDTLDLVERAELAINGLTGNLNPDYHHEMYFLVRYTADPAVMMHMCLGDLAACTPKYAESLPMMRLMSGTDFNSQVDADLMTSLTMLMGEDGP